MRRFACLDVAHGLCNHESPEVLSISCLILGWGMHVGLLSCVHARHDVAKSIIAVANSRSLIEMIGLCMYNVVRRFMLSGHLM